MQEEGRVGGREEGGRGKRAEEERRQEGVLRRFW